MTNMQQHLTAKLQTALNPSHLEVINESNQHSTKSCESHFKLVVVSHAFNEMALIDRHRFINKLFVNELTRIHALSMHTYTPDEWQQKGAAPNSPKCEGGAKS